MIRTRLTHHSNRCSRGSTKCNGRLGRIPPPGVVVIVVFVVVVAATAVVVVRGGERGKATAAKRAFHMGADLNQRCKCGDWLDAEQSPS